MLQLLLTTIRLGRRNNPFRAVQLREMPEFQEVCGTWRRCSSEQLLTSFRAERYLKVENKFLLILVPSVTEAGSGVIEDMLALQNVQFAINQSDTKVLLLRTGSLEFDSDEECHHARAYIESGRQTVRMHSGYARCRAHREIRSVKVK